MATTNSEDERCAKTFCCRSTRNKGQARGEVKDNRRDWIRVTIVSEHTPYQVDRLGSDLGDLS
jgi:hypothetical protein